jgi:hypothetical protein
MARALADALRSARRDGPQVQRDGRQVNARILGVAMKKATRAAGLAPTEGMHMLDENLKLVLAPEQSPLPAVAGTPAGVTPKMLLSIAGLYSTAQDYIRFAQGWRTADSSTARGSSRRARSSW